jgi:hypothetical protein
MTQVKFSPRAATGDSCRFVGRSSYCKALFSLPRGTTRSSSPATAIMQISPERAVCSPLDARYLRWPYRSNMLSTIITMQRALAVARRLPALSSLRPKSASFPEQPQQMQSTCPLLRPRFHSIHLRELRSFHSSSSALAKNLNFNLADIGEGIAEVRVRSSHSSIATPRTK